MLKRRILTLLLIGLNVLIATAEGTSSLRRAISTQQPMWIVHIDTWNHPDPEKIIHLFPDDVRPFVVFCISLSSNDNIVTNGPRVIDSWLNTCARCGVWAMIQPSSGAHNRLPEIEADGTHIEAYEQYFIDYPNFLGYSFAEQFWDFGKNGCPTWEARQQTLLSLLELCHQYGGYLTMSFTQNYDNWQMMPIGMMRGNNALKQAFLNYADNFIVVEKTTMKKGFYDIESACLGMWLSGYAGHYGVRFDTSGWMTNTDERNNSDANSYVEAAALPILTEHMLLTGQTVMDGPEITWNQVTQNATTITTADGYKSRQFALFPHCINIYLEHFRHILRGQYRLLTREEVLARTKVAHINTSTDYTRPACITPATLYNPLYRFACDHGGVSYGTGWQDQRWWTKATGRYPAIPHIWQPVQSLSLQSISQADMSSLFPIISTGDLYVAKEGNTYITYNPYQYTDTMIGTVRTFTNATRSASATIPQVTIPTTLHCYLNNYKNDYAHTPYTEYAPTTDTLVFCGFNQQPQVTLTDEGQHTPSSYTSTYKNNTLTLAITPIMVQWTSPSRLPLPPLAIYGCIMLLIRSA